MLLLSSVECTAASRCLRQSPLQVVHFRLRRQSPAALVCYLPRDPFEPMALAAARRRRGGGATTVVNVNPSGRDSNDFNLGSVRGSGRGGAAADCQRMLKHLVQLLLVLLLLLLKVLLLLCVLQLRSVCAAVP